VDAGRYDAGILNIPGETSPGMLSECWSPSGADLAKSSADKVMRGELKTLDG